MLVTPIKRKFGKYAPGDVFDLRDKTAKVLIKVGKLAAAAPPSVTQSYATRDMRAAPVAVVTTREESSEASGDAPDDSAADERTAEPAEDAPYGYKADGTPRKRPGRPASGG